jgi:putative endonuclease
VVRRNTRVVGAAAEALAGRFLKREGLQSVTRNFRCRLGEIDLVMRDKDCLVFVEVRYRGGHRLARAGLTVDARKQQKLIRTAALFLAKHPESSSLLVRFDVVAIDADQDGSETIEWIRDAFRPGDSAL